MTRASRHAPSHGTVSEGEGAALSLAGVTDATAGDGPDRLLTIGELAAVHGITTRTIRFYEAKGLIRPERRGVARFYSRRDRARLLLILRGKNLGFSLEEIERFLALYDADPSQVAQARALVEMIDGHVADLQAKSADIDRTLRDLKTIRSTCVEHLQKAGR